MVEVCHPLPEYFPEKSTQSEHPVGPKFKIGQSVKSFLDRATPVSHPRLDIADVQMYMDLFRIKCHNKSRQRRNLAKLVQDWEILQLEVSSLHDSVFNKVD